MTKVETFKKLLEYFEETIKDLQDIKTENSRLGIEGDDFLELEKRVNSTRIGLINLISNWTTKKGDAIFCQGCNDIVARSSSDSKKEFLCINCIKP